MSLDILNTVKLGLNNVKKEYYRIITTYNPEGINRERVFAYELYHQIRMIENDSELILHGEIDKRGHVDFPAVEQRNPDFIFHVPGEYNCKSVVVELKVDLNGGIEKDFETLDMFIKNYSYSYGIFIICNHSEEKVKKFIERIDVEKIENKDKIHILIKESAEKEGVQLQLSKIIQKNNLIEI